jgi:hypothetical protein
MSQLQKRKVIQSSNEDISLPLNNDHHFFDKQKVELFHGLQLV